MKKLSLLLFLLSTTSFAGILPPSRGGTGANITPAAGGVVYSTSSGFGVTSAGVLGQRLQSNGTSAPAWSASSIQTLRVATTTPITVSATTDYVVESNLTTAGAVAVTLPGSPTKGLEFFIKDGAGNAATYNITISPAAGNIDGASTFVISTNYGHAHLMYDGTQWVSL